jgi:hypothetical protein
MLFRLAGRPKKNPIVIEMSRTSQAWRSNSKEKFLEFNKPTITLTPWDTSPVEDVAARWVEVLARQREVNMATWDSGKAQIDCLKCGATYECKFTDYPAPDPTGSFECTVCSTTVHSWKGTRDFSDWNLVKRGSW